MAPATSGCCPMRLVKESVLIADQVVDGAHDPWNIFGFACCKYSPTRDASEFLEHFRSAAFDRADRLILRDQFWLSVLSDSPSLKDVWLTGVYGKQRHISFFEIILNF